MLQGKGYRREHSRYELAEFAMGHRTACTSCYKRGGQIATQRAKAQRHEIHTRVV